MVLRYTRIGIRNDSGDLDPHDTFGCGSWADDELGCRSSKGEAKSEE